MALSAKTVSTYHIRIWKKLNVRNDAEMFRWALEQEQKDGG
jgi:DNA-binding NarL/FixJ family response regulator